MRKLALLIAIAVLGACNQDAGPAPATPDRNCAQPRGLPTGELLLFGEIHGSVESPALISEIACSLSGTEAIAVGLEMPSRDQPLIDAYIGSRGTDGDVETLTSSDFWQAGKDGRSSVAMLRLIEDVRALKAGGHTVSLFAFDDQPGTQLERNVAIANGIRRFHASHPEAKIITLMGNIHAMQSEIHTDKGTLVPSGFLLEDLDPVSILITYPAGTTWACMPDCGIQNLTPRRQSVGPPGFRKGAPLGGYSHSYLLPSITASPPRSTHNTGG